MPAGRGDVPKGGVVVSAPRRFTWAAWMLMSGIASPFVIGVGAWVHDVACRPYLGSTVIAYGVTHAVLAVIVGGIGACENGFTTKEYRWSLSSATEEVESLRRRLDKEVALREKFQAALTDGVTERS